MKGLCVETNVSTNLKKGEIYYLFPHGAHYHASRFPRLGSHFGTYQRHYFEIIEERVDDWPPEPLRPEVLPQLDKDKIYTAELVWQRESYSYGTPKGTYFITAIKKGFTCKSDCYFYKDAALQQPKGRYPIHWFENVREYSFEKVKELPQSEWQQIDLFSGI